MPIDLNSELAYESRLLTEASEFSINDAHSDPNEAWRILAGLYRLLVARRERSEPVAYAGSRDEPKASAVSEDDVQRKPWMLDHGTDLAVEYRNRWNKYDGYSSHDMLDALKAQFPYGSHDVRSLEAKLSELMELNRQLASDLIAARQDRAPPSNERTAFVLTREERLALHNTRLRCQVHLPCEIADVKPMIAALDRALATVTVPCPEAPLEARHDECQQQGIADSITVPPRDYVEGAHYWLKRKAENAEWFIAQYREGAFFRIDGPYPLLPEDVKAAHEMLGPLIRPLSVLRYTFSFE